MGPRPPRLFGFELAWADAVFDAFFPEPPGSAPVHEGWGGIDRVRYAMTDNDLRTARKGGARIARMMFDAGAREVWPGIFACRASFARSTT